MNKKKEEEELNKKKEEEEELRRMPKRAAGLHQGAEVASGPPHRGRGSFFPKAKRGSGGCAPGAMRPELKSARQRSRFCVFNVEVVYAFV